MNSDTQLSEQTVEFPATWLRAKSDFSGVFDDILPHHQPIQPDRTLFEVSGPVTHPIESRTYRSPSKQRRSIQALLRDYRAKYSTLKELEDEPVERAAFERAFHLLFLYLDRLSEPLPRPYLADGDEGSIDIIWKDPSRTVLVNVPSKEPIYFSATNGEYSLSGYIPEDKVELGLLDWIQRTS